jgi:uncharacterized protein YhfF
MGCGIVPDMPDPADAPAAVQAWPDEPSEMLGLPAFGFAVPGPLREELTAAVLAGVKTATTSLAVDYVIDDEPLPVVGGRSVVYDSDLRPVAIIETTACRLWTLSLVDDAFALAEGEDYADARGWRSAHEGFWRPFLDAYRHDLGDPAFDLTDSTVVVCEWFRLIERLDGSPQSPS